MDLKYFMAIGLGLFSGFLYLLHIHTERFSVSSISSATRQVITYRKATVQLDTLQNKPISK